MENFVVSARKYRPDTFKSVVGQQALTTTLKNAIVSARLAHAYLFCGPRGVGKTTCARIFAKTINCMHPTSEHEACNECESCMAFNEQRSMNIHELDAASNNSVDDIRNLIAQVRIPPQIGKYSVFIIDEVHMLSQAAFNAFLKTLEEPPAHAIFILATTEKHKILPTILSRCQIYDFSRITMRDIISHLKFVADNEGVKVDEQTLEVVAQKADGGMRDALSIFDQLVSFSGKEISYNTAITNLNVLDSVHYFNLINYALQCDVPKSLLLYDEILTLGFDAQNFINGLGTHLRNLLVSKTPETIRLLESGEKTMEQYKEQAARCHHKFIFKALQIVADAAQQYRITNNKRLCVEIMLIKLCQIMTGGPETEQKTKVQSITSTAVQSAVQNSNNTSAGTTNAAAVVKQSATGTETQSPAQPQNVESNEKKVDANKVNVEIPKIVETQPQQVEISNIDFVAPPSMSTASEALQSTYQAQEKPKETPEQTRKSYGNMAYTEQMIVNAWKQCKTQTKDTRLASIFETLVPQRNGDTDTWSVVLYPLQKQMIEDKMPVVNDFVRQQVSNDNVVINIIVAKESNEVSAKLYMPKDKLEKMMADNPNLNTLIDNFKLRLD